MRSLPLVSIITASYNSEKFIHATIKSVINQTYSNWELIIIDDASSDTTIQIINTFTSAHSNIKCLKNTQNQGAAFTRNRGIKIAKGHYIAFLDADDVWQTEKLKQQITFMEERNLSVSFSSYNLIDENGNSLNRTVIALPKITYGKLLKCNYIGNLTGVYNAKKLGKVYAPNLKKRQDWLLWLEAVKRSKTPALGIDIPLASYRIRANSMSSNKWNLLKYNYLVYHKGLGFSIPKSVYQMVVFLYEYFFIKSKQTVFKVEK